MARNKEADVLTKWQNGGRCKAEQKTPGGNIEVTFSAEKNLAFQIKKGLLPMTKREAWAKLAAVRSDISRREFKNFASGTCL